MFLPNFENISEEERIKHNRATFEQMVRVKLGEISDLMMLPSNMYDYPYAGTTHDARREELIEHLAPVIEAMGIEQFMRLPITVTMACLFSAQHRQEAHTLGKTLHSVQVLFMTLYGSPDTSDNAVEAFNLMMNAIPYVADDTNSQVAKGHSIH